MSKSRKMALVAGVNIEGGTKRVPRANDKWYLDGRILADQHFGNELYKNNRLDRGHLVRREDPVWGENAEQANADTFHYTNSAPQVDMYNQQVWLGLENYILQNARVYEKMVSVFTGPIFSHTDLNYEYEAGNFARIPSAYWKVVAIVKEDGTPSVTAYKISQDKELSELEFVYGVYKTYQISVNEVIDSTGLDFSGLLQYDGFSSSELESLTPRKNLLNSLEDILI